MITPDAFSTEAVAWIEAFTTVLLAAAGKLLLIIAAIAGVWKTWNQDTAGLGAKNAARIDSLEQTAADHTAQLAALPQGGVLSPDFRTFIPAPPAQPLIPKS